MENITPEQIKKILMDFSEWECTVDWWVEGGKKEATSHVSAYLKELEANLKR